MKNEEILNDTLHTLHKSTQSSVKIRENVHCTPSRPDSAKRKIALSQILKHRCMTKDTKTPTARASTTVSQTQQALQLQGTSLEESCHHSSLITSHEQTG